MIDGERFQKIRRWDFTFLTLWQTYIHRQLKVAQYNMCYTYNFYKMKCKETNTWRGNLSAHTANHFVSPSLLFRFNIRITPKESNMFIWIYDIILHYSYLIPSVSIYFFTLNVIKKVLFRSKVCISSYRLFISIRE